MNAGNEHQSGFWARPIGAGSRPRRELLRLTDGYETGMYVHAPARRRLRLPVLYVHGIQSHPGWFVASAMDLARRGHAVYQVTRRGSGRNRADRGHARSAEQLLDDVAVACRFVLERSGTEKLHLLGVSWGGKLLAAYAGDHRRAEPVASLVLVAPGIVPRVDVSTTTKIAIAVALLLDGRRTFEIPLNDVNLFTDNGPMRAYLQRDPFRLYRATARLLFASRRLDRMLLRPPGRLPETTTLLLADKDRIIDNDPTREAVDRLTQGRCRVVTLAGTHSLEFEPDPRRFHEALAEATARAEG